MLCLFYTGPPFIPTAVCGSREDTRPPGAGIRRALATGPLTTYKNRPARSGKKDDHLCYQPLPLPPPQGFPSGQGGHKGMGGVSKGSLFLFLPDQREDALKKHTSLRPSSSLLSLYFPFQASIPSVSSLPAPRDGGKRDYRRMDSWGKKGKRRDDREAVFFERANSLRS